MSSFCHSENKEVKDDSSEADWTGCGIVVLVTQKWKKIQQLLLIEHFLCQALYEVLSSHLRSEENQDLVQ